MQQLGVIARDLFGLHGTAHLLVSERDQNARISTANGDFVLKVANGGEPPSASQLQVAVLSHIANTDPSIPVPRVIPTLGGQILGSWPGKDERHVIRCVTHLPGDPMAGSPHRPTLLTSLGRTAGRLSRCLQGFSHPAAHRPTFMWNLDQAASCRALIPAIANGSARDLVERTFDRVAQVLSGADGPTGRPGLNLRTAVIHQDLNDYNVIVSDNDVTGIIDFGDMCHGSQVNELAIALAYALLDAPDLVACATPLIAGYTGEFALNDDELDVLFDLASLRLAASIAISSSRSRANPDNDYLLVSQGPAVRTLHRLDVMRPGFARAVARSAAGREPVRGSNQLMSWLESDACHPASIFPHDLQFEQRILVSLAADAPGFDVIDDPRAYQAWLDIELDRAAATFAVGQYGEDRSCYRTEAFRGDALDARSVHLGIDLFVAVGTPVRAMLDGVVTTVVNNSARQDYGPTVVLEHQGPQPFWCLYGHLSTLTLDTVHPGQQVRAGDVVGFVGDHVDNGGWAPHLHAQLITDLLDSPDQFGGNFEGACEPSRRDLWTSISPNINALLRLSAETFQPASNSSVQALIERRSAVLGSSLSLSYKKPLHIVRGSGIRLYEHTGRAYLDCVNNVCHVGHAHPAVVRALASQAAMLNTNTRYLHSQILDYAERLASTLPDPLHVVYLVNSGSEANELALRLARVATGRHDVITMDWGYHGNTGNLVDISPYKFNRAGGAGKKSWVHIAELADPFRGAHGANGAAYAQSVADCARLAEANGGAAAFIAESISGCGGQVVLADGYLQAAYQHARTAGAICIADEVQVGLGRIGSAMWAFQDHAVVPDIVTMGKPLGNGHPIGAVVTTVEIAQRFANGMEYFNTFGGNPVSCAVGNAVLDVIETEGLQHNAHHVGSYLLEGFRHLQTDSPLVADVRGRGLYLGIDIIDPNAPLDSSGGRGQPDGHAAAAIANRLRERGVLISTDGPNDNVIKIKPPLVMSIADADRLLDELALALSQVVSGDSRG